MKQPHRMTSKILRVAGNQIQRFMKNITPVLISIAAVVLLLWVFNTHIPGCKPKPLQVDTVLRIDTIPGDSIPYQVLKHVIKPVPVYTHFTDTVWKYRTVDTMAILRAYFETRHYDNVLLNDTSGYIRLLSHVTQNEIYYDSLYFQNKRATIINKYEYQYFNRGIYAGLVSDYKCLRPSVFWVDKKYMIGAGWDIKEKTPIISVGVKIKSY